MRKCVRGGGSGGCCCGCSSGGGGGSNVHMKGIHLLKSIGKESSSFGHIALQKKRQEKVGGGGEWQW